MALKAFGDTRAAVSAKARAMTATVLKNGRVRSLPRIGKASSQALKDFQLTVDASEKSCSLDGTSWLPISRL